MSKVFKVKLLTLPLVFVATSNQNTVGKNDTKRDCLRRVLILKDFWVLREILKNY
jgi:hypothetical protein